MGAFIEPSSIRLRVGTLFLAVCGIVALSGCKEERRVPIHSPSVVIEQPSVRNVPVWTEWIGSLTGVVNASILPQISGYVQSQDYENGAFVKKGDLLFKIEPSIFQDQLAQAKARLEQAKSQWKQADYNQRLYKPLAAENVVSKQKYEDAVLSAQAAKANILAAEAEVSQANLNLSYTTVVSPVDGIAGIASVQVGDLVSPSGKVMAEVSSVNPIRINFAVTEKEWLKTNSSSDQGGIRTGSELTVILPNGETYPFKAKVSSVGRAFETSTGTIPIQATVENQESVLRPGMFVRVRALTKNITDALTVPQKAIYSTQGRFFVVTVADDSAAKVVPVSAGPVLGEEQVIVPLVPGSLTKDTPVVIDGIQEAMMAAGKGIPVQVSGAGKE